MDIRCTIEINLQPEHEMKKISSAVKALFPDAPVQSEPRAFPVSQKSRTYSHTTFDMSSFVEKLQNQRILDTAMDIMSLKCDDEKTEFLISNSAALAGKINFVLENDVEPTGGVAKITLEGKRLQHWIEEITWHGGRTKFPRHIGDEMSFRNVPER